jgi:TRAP-type C4-dicarboxylate transport system permease small subunit
MVHRLTRAYDGLLNAMAALAAASMPVMALAVTYEVVMRYVFNDPTIWAVDLSEYIMLYATFLAAPWLVREGGHIRIEALLSLLSPRNQHMLGVVAAIISAAVAAVLCWQGLDATLDAYTRGVIIARSWRVPRWIVWALIPVGSFFITIEFIRVAVRSWRAARVGAAMARAYERPF